MDRWRGHKVQQGAEAKGRYTTSSLISVRSVGTESSAGVPVWRMLEEHVFGEEVGRAPVVVTGPGC